MMMMATCVGTWFLPAGTSLLFVMVLLIGSNTSAFSITTASQCRTPTVLLSVQGNEFWAPDNKDPLARAFQRDGILYKTSIFTPEELSIIQAEIATMSLKKETTSSVARNRMGAVVPVMSETVEILREGSLTKLMQKIQGPSYALSKKIPVEVRIYEKMGSGMEWHHDDVLYNPPQLEVVVTLENTSDCQTRWRLNEKEVSAETDANSVLVLQAGGIEHCVTSLKRGRRVILKCAYADESAAFREDEMVDQFGATLKQKATKKKKKR